LTISATVDTPRRKLYASDENDDPVAKYLWVKMRNIGLKYYICVLIEILYKLYVQSPQQVRCRMLRMNITLYKYCSSYGI